MCRLKTKENERAYKFKEQEEYRQLFEQNTQREISNEMAYKKRFQDFDKDVTRKNKDFYNVIHNDEYRRAADANIISGADKKSFFEYYDDRDKKKMQRSEEMKADSYLDMKTKIDQNHRNVNELGRKRREDAEKSVQELHQYFNDEKDKRTREKFVQQQYKGILETQVKMKTSRERGVDFNGNEEGGDNSPNTGEMYMVPGINSVSPYVKQQRKGEPPLGEHHIKMKRYIDKDKVYSIDNSMTAQPSANTFREHNGSGGILSHSTPKNALPKSIMSPSPSYKGGEIRPTSLKESGKYSLINDANLYYDPIVNPIPNLNKNKWNIQNLTLGNNRSMTEKMMKRGPQGNNMLGLQRSYNL